MTAAHWALLISGLALAISIAGFIGSIWKEFIYVKPKVQVAFAIMQFFGTASQVREICSLTATTWVPDHSHCTLASLDQVAVALESRRLVF